MATNFHVKGKVEIIFERKTAVVACDLVNGKVTYVDVSSELMGYIFAGDEILTVNGEANIKTTADLNKSVTSKLPGKCVIEFMRDDYCLVEVKELPPRRPNSIMNELTMKFRGGAAPGILIHRLSADPKTILISMVQTGSNACNHVKSGDILVKVNDVFIQDRDAARKLLYSSINNTKAVKITLERSTTDRPLGPAPAVPEGAKSTPPDPNASKMLAASPSITSVMTSPASARPRGKVSKHHDVKLPEDVLQIMKANIDFYKKPCTAPPCIIKVTAAAATASTLKDAEPEIRIPFDPSPKPLKITPKRVGS